MLTATRTPPTVLHPLLGLIRQLLTKTRLRGLPPDRREQLRPVRRQVLDGHQGPHLHLHFTRSPSPFPQGIESAVCSAGKCQVQLCALGRSDCNANYTDGILSLHSHQFCLLILLSSGCESPLNSTTTCGNCTNDCSLQFPERQAPTCSSQRCVAPCACVDAPHVATSSCSGGVCAVKSCSSDWGNCDLVSANGPSPPPLSTFHFPQLPLGCETDLRVTPDHCGECDTSCLGLPNAQSGSCVASSCVLVCKTGFLDCDNDPTTGCEQSASNGPCFADRVEEVRLDIRPIIGGIVGGIAFLFLVAGILVAIFWRRLSRRAQKTRILGKLPKEVHPHLHLSELNRGGFESIETAFRQELDPESSVCISFSR